MPLSLHPDATVPVSLESDAGIAEAERPVFLCRFLTGSQLIDVLGRFDDAIAERDLKARQLKLRDALQIGVAGWRNMGGVPSEPQKIHELLTEEEMIDLTLATIRAPRMAEADKKKSVSQSKSPSANAAPPAPAPAGA